MASGDTLLVFTPHSNQPPASNAATFDTRNGHLVLDFDAGSSATQEDAVFPLVLPSAGAGVGVTVTIVWMATSATGGNVVWEAAWERHHEGTTDLDSTTEFAAGKQAVGAATTGTGSAGKTTYTDITFSTSEMDSIAANESGRLKISRDADHTSDTMTGDAELLRVIVTET